MGYDLYVENPPEGATDYWRESIWTMENFRAVVEELGMLSTNEAIGGDPHDPDMEIIGPIPIYRLCSNDGWLISKVQSQHLFARLEAQLASREDAIATVYATGTTSGGETLIGVDQDHTLGVGKRVIDAFGGLDQSPGTVVAGPAQYDPDRERAAKDLREMLAFFRSAAKGDGFRVH